jgi:hypothetical protein
MSLRPGDRRTVERHLGEVVVAVVRVDERRGLPPDRGGHRGAHVVDRPRDGCHRPILGDQRHLEMVGPQYRVLVGSGLDEFEGDQAAAFRPPLCGDRVE